MQDRPASVSPVRAGDPFTSADRRKWSCRNCTAKTRAQPCVRCGAVREAATRDERGHPVCPACLIVDPANQEVCVGCHRRRPVSVRTDNGPLCNLPAGEDADLRDLRKRRALHRVRGDRRPWCLTCHKRWARCTACNRTRPIRGGTMDEPLCAECVRDEPGFWRTCPGCGQPGRLHRPVRSLRPAAAAAQPARRRARPHPTGPATAPPGTRDPRAPQHRGGLARPGRRARDPAGARPVTGCSPTRHSMNCHQASRSSTCAACSSPSGPCRTVMNR